MNVTCDKHFVCHHESREIFWRKSWKLAKLACCFFFVRERVCVVVIFPSCQHPIHLPPHNSLRCCSRTFPVIFLLYLEVVCSRASWAGIGNARPEDDSQTFSCLPQCCISDCRRWVEQVIYLLLRRAVSSVFPRNSTRLSGGRTHFSTATIGFPALH